MGLDMRIVPDHRLNAIEAALLHAGFAVTVIERKFELSTDMPDDIRASLPDNPIIIHNIVVTDGRNTITLLYGADEGEFGGYRIYIPNLGAWWPRRNRELRAFQTRVTDVLESIGAYWPFPYDVG
jgi:hypothetical protein